MWISLTLKTLQCAPLGNCQKEVKVHLKLLNVQNGSLWTKSQMLPARAGIIWIFWWLFYRQYSKKHKINNFTSNRMYKIITLDYDLELCLMNFSCHFGSPFLTDWTRLSKRATNDTRRNACNTAQLQGSIWPLSSIKSFTFQKHNFCSKSLKHKIMKFDWRQTTITCLR